jgi:hypothetical protein
LKNRLAYYNIIQNTTVNRLIARTQVFDAINKVTIVKVVRTVMYAVISSNFLFSKEATAMAIINRLM